MQRDGHVPPENLGELPIVLGEEPARVAFDVEDPDDLVMQTQRNRQGGMGLVDARQIAGIRQHVGTVVAAPGGGDVATDAVAFGRSKNVEVLRLRGQSGTEDDFETIGFAIEQADREVVEVHQVARVPNDLVFEQREPFPGIQLRELLGIEANDLAARPVDGVDLALQLPGTGVVPDHRRHLREATFGRAHRRDRHLEVEIALDGQGKTSGSHVQRVARLLVFKGVHQIGTPGPDPLDEFGRITDHLGIGPEHVAVAVDDADPLADPLEDDIGLPADGGTLERQEVRCF